MNPDDLIIIESGLNGAGGECGDTNEFELLWSCQSIASGLWGAWDCSKAAVTDFECYFEYTYVYKVQGTYVCVRLFVMKKSQT